MSSSPDAAQPDQSAHVAFTPPTVEELGAMLPSYDVEFLIASGGMGAVYKAVQKDLDREVAIKILPPEAGNDAESMAQFRSEARAMAKLNHNNIVSIYDFGAVQGQCYFVMEYVEGRSVHEMIGDGQVTPELASNWMSQVCDALSYAHSKGIIHGDIKPSNIVVNADGTVKLLDFGLARLMEQDQSDTDVEWVPMGTPEYAAPELYERGAVADPRTDIYALGVVYYEMLTGTAPQGTFALPGTTMRLDGRVDDIIVRCLRPEPENRFQSAADIRHVLDDIRTGKPLVPVAPDAARHGQPHRPGVVQQKRPRTSVPTGSANMQRVAKYGSAKKPKSKVGLIVAAAAVIVIAALAAMKLLGPKETPPVNPPSSPAKKTEASVTPSETVTPVVPEPEKSVPEVVKETEPAPSQEKPPMVQETPPSPPPTAPPVTPPVPVVAELPAGVTRLKTEFTERYKLEIQNKMQMLQRDVSDKYLAALTKMEQGFMSKADAAAVLQIRKEKDRFAKNPVAPTGVDLATQEQVLDLQKKLGIAFENLKKAVAVPIAKLNAEFSEALNQLANSLNTEGKKDQAEAVKAFQEKGAKESDYVGVLAGAVESAAPPPPPPSSTTSTSTTPVIEEGNVALASRGAEALAEDNPMGIIDGKSSRDEGAWSSEGGSIQVNLGKVYSLAQIFVHLPTRGSDSSYHFAMELSEDGNKWSLLEERVNGVVSGFQSFYFSPRPVKSIRLVVKTLEGTKRFLVEEIFAYCPTKVPSKIATAEDFKTLLCHGPWTWERADKDPRPLTFIPDGEVATTNWLGTYSVVSANEVHILRITKDGKKEIQLKFAPDYQSFEGMDDEGEKAWGKIKK